MSIEEFSHAELASFSEVKRLLDLDGVAVSIKELIIACMNSDLNASAAVDKYKKWQDSLKDFGIASFDDVWRGILSDGSESEEMRKLTPMLATFAGCGRDSTDRGILWIRKHPVERDEEALAIRASCIYFTAVCADMKSLRDGITFVIDTTETAGCRATGNEAKLQQSRRCMPVKSDRVNIMGANYLKRVFLNSIFSIASLNVRFAELSDIKATVPNESLPAYLGGQGGGIVTTEDIYQWVKTRLAQFPTIPEI